ncbi:MAG: thiol-disulfide isomerase/thioredoxin [Flammeovirgaceae bacterium]|jgi:thiol-disulfide isomerase/thioredoxin
MKSIFTLFMVGFCSILFLSCKSNQNEQTEMVEQIDISGNKPDVNLPMGKWEGSFQLTDEASLPVRFEIMQIKGAYPVIELVNGEERISINNISKSGDSISIGMHIFNTEVIAKLEGNSLKGRWIKKDFDNYSIPFEAKLVKDWTVSAEVGANDISGKWSVIFNNEDEDDEKAVGVFEQKGTSVTGTFLTATGDYRYLWGTLENGKMELSCFDGEHAFLFTATVTNSNKLENGTFWSGKHWKQAWSATRNENASLPNANELTFLKEGYDEIAFSFPNLDSQLVSLSDKKYKGKVVIVQLLGSWCPNCMDETKFLSPYYKANQSRNLEIIGLGFERSPEFSKAKARLEKMKNRFGIGYDLLVAGTNSKTEAAEKLPMLNHVMSFPTTIFIDRKGKVRKIHTGFSGPGTGEYYQAFVEDFNLTMDKLLAEK